jgi:hypothetical protein
MLAATAATVVIGLTTPLVGAQGGRSAQPPNRPVTHYVIQGPADLSAPVSVTPPQHSLGAGGHSYMGLVSPAVPVTTTSNAQPPATVPRVVRARSPP